MSIDRQEPLRNLATIIARIYGMRGTGRLAVRNTVRMGTLHLYFEFGRLVHVEGSRASIDDCLIDLAGWTDGLVRFDIGVLPERQTMTPEQEEFFNRTLLLLQQRGVVDVPSRPIFRPPGPQPSAAPPLDAPKAPLPEMTPPGVPVMPVPPNQEPGYPGSSVNERALPGEARRVSHRVSPPSGASFSGPLPPAPPTSVPLDRVEVLLSSRQWEVLVEVVRAMLEAVGRLFGQRQAQNILEHVLAESSSQAEVLGWLQVDRHGWLREWQPGEMLNQPVQAVASAFAVLISNFERRCAALLGEEKARQIIARALSPYQEALAEIGIALNLD